MTTEPDRLQELETLVRRLRSDVLDSALKVHELEFHLQRQDERMEAIMLKLFDWCAPQSLKDEIASINGVGFDETKTPDDVASALDEWMKRGR
ncbi:MULTISPECIES: hypothetical protein [Aurantimonas]|uniref:hypothetical protein n=1 Tax=Aurantimonas TaxID=182269 RepID=UPI0035172852